MRMRTRLLMVAGLLVAAGVAAACGGGQDGGSGNAGTPPGAESTPRAGRTPLATVATGEDGQTPPPTPAVAPTEEHGRSALLGEELFVLDRTLPATAIASTGLAKAGTASGDDGSTVKMARASSPEVAGWERVSEGPDGWLVWRPAVVPGVLQDAGAGATLVSVQEVDWPDSCLGAPLQDEACAQVITPGYRIIVNSGVETFEYHASKSGRVRRVV